MLKEVSVKEALLALDPNILLPSSMFNLKKKVDKFLASNPNSQFEIIGSFYDINSICFVGDACQKIGIDRALLIKLKSVFSLNSNFDEIAVFSPAKLSNEVIIELYIFKEKNNFTWDLFRIWLKYFYAGNNNDETIDDKKTLAKNIKKLSSRKKDLNWKKKKSELDLFLSTEFSPYSSSKHNEKVDFKKVYDSIIDNEKKDLKNSLALAHSDMKFLMEKCHQLNERVELLQNCLSDEISSKDKVSKSADQFRDEIKSLKLENDLYSKKLGDAMERINSLSPRNVRKRIKRREEKINDLKNVNSLLKEDLKKALLNEDKLKGEAVVSAKGFENEIERLNALMDKELIWKTRFQKLKWYKNTLKEKLDDEILGTSYDSRISELKDQVILLEIEKLEIEEKLNDYIGGTIQCKENGKYNDAIRATYQDLVCMGVGVNNVERIIKTVLGNLTNLKADCLPKTTFARLMFTESRRLSQLQVAEKLIENYEGANNTLHSDGTSKFGKHYETYDVMTKEGQSLTVGIREVSSGDSETQLKVLVDILKEIENSLQNSSENNAANKIVASIKNVMSDRHIVQKKFNSLFQEYRISVLPDVIDNWQNLDKNTQQKFSKVNEFFCGLHFLTGLADQSEAALKAWDKLLYDNKLVGSLAKGGYSKGDSGTYRLIQSLCKAVQTRGCEKSGRISDFHSFLTKECGFSSVPFATFKGNRFNILFYNAGILYFLRDYLQRFFETVKDDNKLLKAVYADLQIQSYICGCRALGLINKFISGPLWRLLESNIHILDISKYYQKMATLFEELSIDATPILKGNITFFDDSLVSKDGIYDCLIKDSNCFDEPTKQCLEIIFGSLCIVTRRMLNDHLENGKYDTNDNELRKESASVSSTNSISERDFGMLDRLIREKPNCNMITYEAIIMSRVNKTSAWRDSLTPEKRALMMKWARESTSKQYVDFKNRRVEVNMEKNEKRLKKIEENKAKEARALVIKESICKDIGKYGGVWLTEKQIDEELFLLSTDAEKRVALKCQLQFRQKFNIKSPNTDKKNFQLSEKGKNKTIAELTFNLRTIVQDLERDRQILNVSESRSLPILIPKNKLSEEKQRLKKLCRIEEEKQTKKNQPPNAKKKKANENDLSNIPVVSAIGELVGKRVEHFTFDYDGKEKWFAGVVLCQKPGTMSELIIRYDCEDNVYSFDFEDFSNAIVRLLPVTHKDFIGKKIRQKFTNDSSDENWWETGLVICCDSDDSSAEFTVNLFDDCEGDTPDSFYEVLKIPLLTDYLNHDVQFL